MISVYVSYVIFMMFNADIEAKLSNRKPENSDNSTEMNTERGSSAGDNGCAPAITGSTPGGGAPEMGTASGNSGFAENNGVSAGTAAQFGSATSATKWTMAAKAATAHMHFNTRTILGLTTQYPDNQNDIESNSGSVVAAYAIARFYRRKMGEFFGEF